MHELGTFELAHPFAPDRRSSDRLLPRGVASGKSHRATHRAAAIIHRPRMAIGREQLVRASFFEGLAPR